MIRTLERHAESLHGLPHRPVAWLVLAAVLLPGVGLARPADTPGDTLQVRAGELHRAYAARVDTLIDFYADQVPPTDYTRGGYIHIAANLYRGRNLDWVLARLDTLMEDPRGDMFWMYPFITAAYTGRDLLPPDVQARMRDLWRTYTPYRGDTENHWVLYYTSLYLATQLYPDAPGSAWFTGKSSKENADEAVEWLLEWMDLTTTIGQGEYDSPHYIKVYLAPMAMLYAWAPDPAIRQRAAMMLDYLIADFAVESLNGLYSGAHSRLYEREVVEPWQPAAARFSWLLFGNTPYGPSGESFILAVSGYEPPPILHDIATDRSRPYVHREYKRTRHRMRNSGVMNAPVYKYMYMRPEYALGSTQGGLLQPIQQQTWSLNWAVPDPRGVHNTLFTVQPYSSPFELQMYFAEMKDFITEIVVRSKTEYDSPDKWTGGSPYEQVFQHEDALVALYDIEDGNRFPHINGFFSKDLNRLEEDASGWIFAQGGEALIAYYPMAPYEWRDHASGDMRLYSPHLKNGAVIQVAPASAYDSFEAFADAVRALPLETRTEPTPSVQFTTLGGDRLTAAYGETPTVDGTPVDYEAWKLYDGPFLQADRGSKTLDIRYGALRRTLNFKTLTVTEWVDDTASGE